MVQGELDKADRQKVMCLITLNTNYRDKMIIIQKENVRKPDEF